MPWTPLMPALLLALLAAALWTDLRSRRIPNLLLAGGLIAALSLQAAAAGGVGIAMSLSGLAVGAGVFLPIFLLQGMGAGDVKLMGVVGAFLGPTLALIASAATLLVGLVIALPLWVHHRLRQRAAAPRGVPAGRVGFAYAPAIVAGTLATLWLATRGSAL